MKFLIQSVKENFISDYKSKKFSAKQLTQKYKFKNPHDVYMTVSTLRKEGLLPETALSKSIKQYYKSKKVVDVNITDLIPNTVKDKNTPVIEYRTVYFKDFTVQIHKKTMARLVVDQNNNLHILNG
jgi:hypothetical protein